jgi:hypothetical protein
VTTIGAGWPNTECVDIDPRTPCMHNRLINPSAEPSVCTYHATRANHTEIRCSGSLLTTGKAIDEPHLLIRERALHRRNLTLRTAIARSHNSLKPYSNKLPL